MMAERPRVVFDCNVYFQALISPRGPAGQCLESAEKGRLTLFVSDATLAELRDVCLRPVLARRFAITSDALDVFMHAVLQHAVRLRSVPHVFDYDRDPDDAIYIDLAAATGARLVVSRDRDLLALQDPTSPDGLRLRERFPQLRIVTPSELLAQLG